MRVLFITQELDQDSDLLGVTLSWIQALARRVDHVHVLALSVGHVSLPRNVTVRSMGKEHTRNRAMLLARFYAALLSLAARREIDLVFAHMVPHYAILAAPAARAFGLPVVLWYTRAAVTGRLRLAHRLVQRVVTASRESFRLPTDKLVITGHGIDVERFSPDPTTSTGTGGSPVLLAVARLTRVKDHETLLRAVALLRVREPGRELRVRIVGAPFYGDDQAYAAELRALATQLGIADLVDFAGSLPNHTMPREYRAADVVVNTSRTGSVDKVVLEAMACGRPVLTCNEAFAPILGAHAVSLMFPPGDAVALADRLAYVVTRGPDEVAALGQDLRRITVRDHSLDGWADRLVAVFESLVGGAPAQSVVSGQWSVVSTEGPPPPRTDHRPLTTDHSPAHTPTHLSTHGKKPQAARALRLPRT